MRLVFAISGYNVVFHVALILDFSLQIEADKILQALDFFCIIITL
jgi:hypothetical protein